MWSRGRIRTRLAQDQDERLTRIEVYAQHWVITRTDGDDVESMICYKMDIRNNLNNFLMFINCS